MKNLKNSEDVIRYLKENDLPENFCIIPFVNLILGPGGDVSICRQKGSKHIVGSLKENSLEEIWNNEYMRRWRKEFLMGQPKICENEVKNVHCHLSPEHYWDKQSFERTEKQAYPFPKLTANLNGECNLRCVMCDVWRQENGYYKEENFWGPGRENLFPHIKEIEMLSGEPLIQADTFKMFEEVISVNPDILWSITTNGYWDFEGEIEKWLKKLKIKRFIFSIDSFQEQRYQKIRVNGNLSKVLENVEKVSSLGNQAEYPFQPSIHFLLMINNSDELLEAVKKTKELGAKFILDVCEYPKNLSVFTMPEDKRKELVKSYLVGATWEELSPAMGVILRLINSLDSKNKKELLLQVIERREGA